MNFPSSPSLNQTYSSNGRTWKYNGSAWVIVASSSGAATADKLTTARTISATGDLSWATSFDGSANATGTATLASVNTNTGTFGSASQIASFTVNAKGLITAATTFSLGTAAGANTGTSGSTIPLLSGTNTWSGQQTFSGITMAGDILPASDSTYSLGSATKRWKDVFVSANTIHLGDATQLSGTSIVVDAGGSANNLASIPTVKASKLVAVPYTYNPGGGNVTVRPSIEFQINGDSYPISLNTSTFEFSLDALGNYGTGSLVAKKVTLSNAGSTALSLLGDLSQTGNYLNLSTTSTFRFDGDMTFGYDAARSLLVKASTTFASPVNFQGAINLGDGNDTITVNAGGSNFIVAANNFSIGANGNVSIAGNLTVSGTTFTVNSNDVNIGDSILNLNSDIGSGTDPTENGGIQIARGTQSAAKWLWDETVDAWSPMGADIKGVASLTASGAVSASNVSGINTGDQTITLTGDITGSGKGSFAATLATVNSNVGTYGSSSSIPILTVNGKGLITAASSATFSAVSSFAFANANGIAGTVADPTSNPTLSLSLNNISPTTIVTTGSAAFGRGIGAARLSIGAAQNGNGTSAPTLGTAPLDTGLFLSDYTGQYGLLAGVHSASGNVWLQTQRVDGTASAYSLNLQPSGGNVGIGTTTPASKLHLVGSLTLDQGNRTNIPSISLLNVGPGTAGLLFGYADGGALGVGNLTGPIPTIETINRSMLFSAVNSAYDASPNAFLFINKDADARKVIVARQGNSTATGNLFEGQDSTGATKFSVAQDGTVNSQNNITAQGSLFSNTGNLTLTSSNGDPTIQYNAGNYYVFELFKIGQGTQNYQTAYTTQAYAGGRSYNGNQHNFNLLNGTPILGINTNEVSSTRNVNVYNNNGGSFGAYRADDPNKYWVKLTGASSGAYLDSYASLAFRGTDSSQNNPTQTTWGTLTANGLNLTGGLTANGLVSVAGSDGQIVASYAPGEGGKINTTRSLFLQPGGGLIVFGGDVQSTRNVLIGSANISGAGGDRYPVIINTTDNDAKMLAFQNSGTQRAAILSNGSNPFYFRDGNNNDLLTLSIGKSATFYGTVYSPQIGIGTNPTYTFEVLSTTAASTAKIRKGTTAGGDLLVLDVVNSATKTNWIKFATNNEQYAYGAIYTDAYALAMGAQFNLQLMPGSIGGSAQAGVAIGYNDYTSTPASRLGIVVGVKGQIGLNVLGISGQTANLQQWGIYTDAGSGGSGITYTNLAAITPTGGATFSGSISASNLTGTNTGDQTTITGNAGSATKLQTGRTLAITGDLTWTSPTFDGTGNITAVGTLATVNSNTGAFGTATTAPVITVNGKGLITAVSTTTITPAFSSITGKPTTLGGYGITDSGNTGSANTWAGNQTMPSLSVDLIAVKTINTNGLQLNVAYNDSQPNVFITGAQDGSKVGFNTSLKYVAPTTALSWNLGTPTNPWNIVYSTTNIVSSTVQLQDRIRLTGQEFYQSGNTSTDGISLLLGVNRASNRQLWIADSARLTQNTTNPVLRISIGSSAQIDTVSTDGTTVLPLSIQGSGGTTTFGGTVIIPNTFNVGTTSGSWLINFAGSGSSNAGAVNLLGLQNNAATADDSHGVAIIATNTANQYRNWIQYHASSHRFMISDVEKMRLDSSGILSVGRPNPTFVSAVSLVPATSDTNDIRSRLTFGTDGSGYGFAIAKNQGGSSAGVYDLLVVRDSGNVGIGIARPLALLHAVSGSNTFRFNNGASNVTPNISLGTSAGKSVGIAVGTNGASLVFDSNGYLAIASDSKANIDGGSSNGGTLLFTVRASGTIQAFSTLSSDYLAATANSIVAVDKIWSAASPVVLAYATTIAINMATFLNATLTLTGNATLGTPSNAKPGQSGYIAVTQDSTGSRTLAYASGWKFAGGTAPTLTTTAGALDIIHYEVLTSSVIVLTGILKDVK